MASPVHLRLVKPAKSVDVERARTLKLGYRVTHRADGTDVRSYKIVINGLGFSLTPSQAAQIVEGLQTLLTV